MTDEIRKLLTENVVVKLWPDAGRILKLSRNGTYSAAAAGHIKTIHLGKLKRVPTAWLRQQTGIDEL